MNSIINLTNRLDFKDSSIQSKRIQLKNDFLNIKNSLSTNAQLTESSFKPILKRPTLLSDALRDRIVEGQDKITRLKDSIVVIYFRKNENRDAEWHNISYNKKTNETTVNYGLNILSGGGSVEFKFKGKVDTRGGPGNIMVIPEKGKSFTLRSLGDRLLTDKLKQDREKQEESCNTYFTLPFFGRVLVHRNVFCGPDPSVERVTSY